MKLTSRTFGDKAQGRGTKGDDDRLELRDVIGAKVSALTNLRNNVSVDYIQA